MMVSLLAMWACLGLLVIGRSAFHKTKEPADIWIWFVSGMAIWVFVGGLVLIVGAAFIGGLV